MLSAQHHVGAGSSFGLTQAGCPEAHICRLQQARRGGTFGPSAPRWDQPGCESAAPEVSTWRSLVIAHVGDRIVVRANRQGQADRDGEILDVRGPDGTAPYSVRWSSDGHTGLFFPSADAYIADPPAAPNPA